MKINTVENLFTPSVLAVMQQQFADPLINWGTYDPALCKDQRMHDWYQMTHMIWENDDPCSALYTLASVVLAQAMDRSGRQVKRMFRARLINSHPGDLGRALAHIDLQGPHNTGLFFPMASSGNTVIYKERSMLESWDRAESLSVAQELEPKENTWYDFDGTHWRISGRPVDHDQRICLVINFIATTPQPLE